MFTLILAWINSKYKTEYSVLFLGTLYLDSILLEKILKYI